MHCKPILALTCMTALSCSAVADDALPPDPHSAVLNIAMTGDGPASRQGWEANPGDGRLSYLQASQCAPGNCAVRPPRYDLAERDYIKSLHLGSYGPMDLKFTGNRVKLKVEF